MSTVGVVSIGLGALSIWGRSYLLVAPERTLRWFRGVISSNGRLRALGAVMLMLGATLIWAGASEESGLASVLSVVGWAFVVMSTLGLILFPAAYRAVANAFLPSEPSGSLTAWRIRGLIGVILGVLLIYFGALSL